jgi:hypothetical protein
MGVNRVWCGFCLLGCTGGRCIALTRVERKTMETYNSRLTEIQREHAESLDREELLLVVAYFRERYPASTSAAYAWAREVAESVSEHPSSS